MNFRSLLLPLVGITLVIACTKASSEKKERCWQCSFTLHYRTAPNHFDTSRWTNFSCMNDSDAAKWLKDYDQPDTGGDRWTEASCYEKP